MKLIVVQCTVSGSNYIKFKNKTALLAVFPKAAAAAPLYPLGSPEPFFEGDYCSDFFVHINEQRKSALTYAHRIKRKGIS
jgi:hypothetical protein